MGANFGQQSLYGMSLNEILLPQLLFEAGYSTMALGKWHLGHHVNYLPQHRGFEHWVGIPYRSHTNQTKIYIHFLNIHISKLLKC